MAFVMSRYRALLLGDDEFHSEAVLSMLRTNRTLEYLELTVPDEIYKANAVDMKRHHNEQLPIARERFPLACRLAFASVFDANRRHHEPGLKRAKHDSTTASSVLAHFPVERHLMSRIFDFAAERVRHRVDFHSWDHSWRRIPVSKS